MKKLKILQVSDAYYPFPGGVSEHLYSLSKALRKRGHDVYILTASYGKEDEKFNDHVHRVGRVIILPLNKSQITLTFDPLLAFKVKNFLKRNSFDIVHTHGPLAPNLPCLATVFSPYPVVSTFHTSFVGFNWYRVSSWFFKFAWKRIKVAIAVSETAKNLMEPYFKGEYEIIPNGVDTERFRPYGDIHPIYKNLKGKTILFVGRLEPRKGPDILLKTFIEFEDIFKDVHLIFAGDGPLRKTLEESVPERLKGRVHFLGRIPFETLPSVYRGADVYTSPAIGGETFGLVLLESMASGVPVVAAINEGYVNVIKNGENGIMVNVKDRREYAYALYKVLNDESLRDKLIRNGIRTALEYSWDRIAEKVEEVYYRIIKV